MKYKIVYKATDRLLKEAITLDSQVFSKKDVGVFEMCKKWLEKREKSLHLLALQKSLHWLYQFCANN